MGDSQCLASSLPSEPTPSPDKSSLESGDFDLFWWPDLESFEDLTVMEIEERFLFSAPVGTLCSDWLDYWFETPEREAIFSKKIQKVFLDHANKILEQNGESTLTDEQENNSSDSQEVGAGSEQAD